MSGVKTNFNIAPYYDDYDKDKNFHRILFRPGFAVQARELTQLQTILQQQVTRFGDNIFKEGSKVFGGDVTLNTQVNSLKLESAYDSATVQVGSFDGKTIILSDDNTLARWECPFLGKAITIFYDK